MSLRLRSRVRWRVMLGAAVIVGTAACQPKDNPNELRFWALGREGEVVKDMMKDFEREHPGVTVRVQQIPWSAAHEKLLTAHVGDVTPDVAQIGNTWVPEFVALRALEPLTAKIANSTVVSDSAYFSGVWDTNVLSDTVWGIPWYVDTRLMYYRSDMLRRAGWAHPPRTWSEWKQAMAAVQKLGESSGAQWGAFVPTNEWNLPVILALQNGSPLLADNDSRGAFQAAPFRSAFEYFVSLYRSGLAPRFGSNDVANLYQEFARGRFAFYVSGPWQIGEFSRRLPASMEGNWATAPMPAPDAAAGGAPGISLAGGSSLIVFSASKQKPAAWQLVEFLSRPEQQARFYGLTGDLPARKDAWRDPKLANDSLTRAFYKQLLHVLPTPKVPEWELIATRIIDHAETVVRGNVSIDDALAALDRDVNNILDKRRWLLARKTR